jgi:hypothetical protein
MSQNLIIVARNPQPKRELYHPDLWLLYIWASVPSKCVYRKTPVSQVSG